ncbi:MAG: hypothetical protein FWE39_20600 [Nocardiaceae bacterium]|nr:hypothetical protein [Nocardiaceae bacterium]
MAIFAVTTVRGPAWDPERGVRQQAGWDEHAAFMDGLVQRGHVVLGGPIGGEGDEVALLAMRAEDAAAIRDLFADDPWSASGVLSVGEIRAWTIWLGSIG